MSEKILLVDDDVDTLRLVGLMLQRQGYQVRAANSGAQALAIIEDELPDFNSPRCDDARDGWVRGSPAFTLR